jgi:thiol-disulfide isomerase/thioredoxin
MLSYWATWCPHCMAMVPAERSVVKRLEGKPFALIGVNGDRNGEKKNLKTRMEKEQITWRSFADGFGGAGPIDSKWNVHAWPAVFIIDHNGVIRHRMGGASADALNQAIDPLVSAARKSAGR